MSTETEERAQGIVFAVRLDSVQQRMLAQLQDELGLDCGAVVALALMRFWTSYAIEKHVARTQQVLK